MHSGPETLFTCVRHAGIAPPFLQASRTNIVRTTVTDGSGIYYQGEVNCCPHTSPHFESPAAPAALEPASALPGVGYGLADHGTIAPLHDPLAPHRRECPAHAREVSGKERWSISGFRLVRGCLRRRCVDPI